MARWIGEEETYNSDGGLMKIFVVVRVDWEYNDEVWYQPEGEGVTPVKGFRSEQVAQQECDRLNKENECQSRGMNTNYYEEGGEDEYAVLYKVIPLEVDDE